LSACGHDRIILRPAGESDAHVSRGLSSAPRPIEMLSGRLKDGSYPRIIEMGKSEGQRICTGCGCKFIHEGLTREVIRSSTQTPIRTLAQGRIGTCRQDARIGYIVRSVYCRAARVDAREVPGDQRALAIQPAFALDDSGGTAVGPGEFLGPRPVHG